MNYLISLIGSYLLRGAHRAIRGDDAPDGVPGYAYVIVILGGFGIMILAVAVAFVIAALQRG